jgi:NAD(P)H-dependent flavin oxidoreductase YrpB (nitropropane dioxygenase family)
LHHAVICLQALLVEDVPVIAFYFGIPEQQLLSKIQAAGAFTMGTATCLQEAQKLQEAGGQ